MVIKEIYLQGIMRILRWGIFFNLWKGVQKEILIVVYELVVNNVYQLVNQVGRIVFIRVWRYEVMWYG